MERRGVLLQRLRRTRPGHSCSGQNRDQKVYYHRLGTPQNADELVYSDPQHPLRYLSASVSRDGRMLFITATEGTSGTEILYKKLDPASAAPARMSAPARASVSKGTTPGYGFKVLFPGFAYDYSLVYGYVTARRCSTRTTAHRTGGCCRPTSPV
ncbi:MAG: hypothetical protein ACLR8Y_07180 [Alistipes indistinctus]